MDRSNIEQFLVNSQETVVSNVNDIHLRLNSLENKMHEFHHLVSKYFEKSNQQKEKSVKKNITQEVMSTDSKMTLKKSVDMLKDSSSISEFLDKFLFGSEEEQKMFESLCHKWTIKHFDKMELNKDYSSDTFFIQDYDLKAQLKLRYKPDGPVYFNIGFHDVERGHENIKSKHPPLITIIFKDCSGKKNKQHILHYEYYFVTYAFPFNLPDNWMQIKKNKFDKLISPTEKSLEVLFLMNSPTNFDKLHSTNGVLSDSIHHFEEKLEHMLTLCHWSPPFLTHPHGHSIIVRITSKRYCNERRSELLATIYVFRNEAMTSGNSHHVTITLIHPTDTSKNIVISKEVNYRVNNCWYTKIEKIFLIKNRGLISNNSLNYQVSIQQIK